MKNLLKIWTLSLMLIASLFLLDNAADATWIPGNVTLKVNGTANSCVYGTSLDLSSGNYSSSIFNLTGTFTGAFSGFYCADNSGVAASWAMTLQATTALTGQYGQTIPRTGIYMKTQPTVMSNGTCGYSQWTTSWTAISTAQTIVAKTGVAGSVCKLSVTGVMLYIIVPAYQSVGTYTGTLSLDTPY